MAKRNLHQIVVDNGLAYYAVRCTTSPTDKTKWLIENYYIISAQKDGKRFSNQEMVLGRL
jgi:hypothetical protein